MNTYSPRSSGLAHYFLPVLMVAVIAFIGGYVYLNGSLASTLSGAVYFESGVSGKCLDDSHDIKTNYTKVQLYTCNKSAAQQWVLNANGTIENANGACLDLDQAKEVNNTKIVMYSCNTNAAQQWQGTNNTLVNPASGKCIDDPYSSTTNGTQLVLYICKGTSNQQWKAVSASGSRGAGSVGGDVSVPPYYFGTLDTQTATASQEASAGVKVAMLELNWSSYEPSQGQFSTSYISEVKSQLSTFKSDGMDVTLALGISDPPDWVLKQADGQYIDQYGHASGEANVIFSQTVRNEVTQYLQRINQDLGFSNFWAVRLSSGGDAEMLYPDESVSTTGIPSYWAYDTAAQNGSDLASGMAKDPLPGWKPGQENVTPAQVANWVSWYISGLDNVTRFFTTTISGLGFKGYYQVLTPGSGTRPDALQTAIDDYLDNNDPTIGAGAVWATYYAGLSGTPHIIAYVTSMADNSGTPNNNQCDPSDDSVSITSSVADNWSATRWISRLADQYGFLKMGEPPDWGSTQWATSSEVSYYNNETTSGLMAQTFGQMKSCKFIGIYWAHDNMLWGVSPLPFSLYVSYITQANNGVYPLPPMP